MIAIKIDSPPIFEKKMLWFYWALERIGLPYPGDKIVLDFQISDVELVFR